MIEEARNSWAGQFLTLLEISTEKNQTENWGNIMTDLKDRPTLLLLRASQTELMVHVVVAL